MVDKRLLFRLQLPATGGLLPVIRALVMKRYNLLDTATTLRASAMAQEQTEELIRQGQGEQSPHFVIIHCPTCKKLHYDRGKFAMIPHKVHRCRACGTTWQPSENFTYGVPYLRPHDVAGTDQDQHD